MAEDMRVLGGYATRPTPPIFFRTPAILGEPKNLSNNLEGVRILSVFGEATYTQNAFLL